jgi:hypothetical protein
VTLPEPSASALDLWDVSHAPGARVDGGFECGQLAGAQRRHPGLTLLVAGAEVHLYQTASSRLQNMSVALGLLALGF